MAIDLSVPRAADLEEVVAELARWQRPGGPVQLHPGDLGWASTRGPAVLASHLRVWRRSGAPVVLGMLDGPALIRLALAPEVDDDAELAERVARDLGDPTTGVLPAGEAAVEARSGPALQARLTADGWSREDPWVPLRLDLTAEPPDVASDLGVQVEHVDDRSAADWFAVHGAAFGGSGEVRWDPLRSSVPFRDGLSLLGRVDGGTAAACVAAWSAGAGRPGLIEPLGVHPDHRRRGLARAMNLAAARELRRRDASEVIVCTPRTQVGAVEAYVASGFTAEDDVRDFVRRETAPTT